MAFPLSIEIFQLKEKGCIFRSEAGRKVAQWFTRVDPLAAKYAAISPYAYVANNPIIFIDPDGMQIEPQSSVEAPVIKEYREFVDAKVRKYDEITANSSNKRAQRRQKNRFNYKYVQIQQELNELDNAPEIFRVRMGKNVTSSKGGGNIRYNPSTGEIDLNLSDRGDWSTLLPPILRTAI